MYYIYKHTCPNGKVYIGVTGDIDSRWQNGNAYSGEFYADILKFGWDNIEHCILDQAETRADAGIVESYWIIKHDANNPEKGYNKYRGVNTGVINTRYEKKMIHRVRCVETGVEYPNAYQAYKATGINNSNISNCCKGKRNTAGGYHWVYAEAEQKI